MPWQKTNFVICSALISIIKSKTLHSLPGKFSNALECLHLIYCFHLDLLQKKRKFQILVVRTYTSVKKKSSILNINMPFLASQFEGWSVFLNPSTYYISLSLKLNVWVSHIKSKADKLQKVHRGLRNLLKILAKLSRIDSTNVNYLYSVGNIFLQL